MDYVLGGALGTLVAFAFSIPAILMEVTQKGVMKESPLVIDVKTIFGRALKQHEVFLIGLLLHLLIGFFFGLVYIVFVVQGWLFVTNAPYTIESFFVYAILSWIFTNAIIYPALGMGFFAQREGARVWLETLVSHLVLGFCLWLLVQYFQPVYFHIPT